MEKKPFISGKSAIFLVCCLVLLGGFALLSATFGASAAKPHTVYGMYGDGTATPLNTWGTPGDGTPTPAATRSTGSLQTVDPSTWVTYSGKQLTMVKDAQNNAIPDFSYAGYENGMSLPLPSSFSGAQAVTFTPSSSINDIQSALMTGGSSSTSPKIVELAGGTYTLNKPLTLQASNLILEGSPSASDPTILRGTGTTNHLVDIAGQGTMQLQDKAGLYTIADSYVPVGARQFTIKVANGTSPFAVGQSIVVNIPVTKAWTQMIGMSWVKSVPLAFDRTIQAVSPLSSSGTQTITIDAPITTAIDSAYTRGSISRYTYTRRISNVGVENLTLDGTAFNAAASGSIASPACSTIAAVDNGWMQNVICKNFVNGISVESTAKRVTLYHLDMQMASMPTHAHPAAYTVSGQQVLCDQCNVEGDSVFAWLTQSWVMGPNAFVNSVATGTTHLYAGAHQRWANGTLFDNVKMVDASGKASGVFRLENEGTGNGGGRGWSGANEVVWNSVAKSYYLQDAPTAYIWVFGSPVNLLKPSYEPQLPIGKVVYASPATPMTVPSLYFEQLYERNLTSDTTALCGMAGSLLATCQKQLPQQGQ